MSFRKEEEDKLRELLGVYSPGVAPIANIAALDATVAKTDIDDAGTIDGTELAVMLSADHVVINKIIAVLEDFGLILPAV